MLRESVGSSVRSLPSGVLVFCLLLVGAAMWSAFDAAFPCALAKMPFARISSDHKRALDVQRPKWVLLIRRFQPALCISSCLPFPISSTPLAAAPHSYASVTVGSR